MPACRTQTAVAVGKYTRCSSREVRGVRKASPDRRGRRRRHRRHGEQRWQLERSASTTRPPLQRPNDTLSSPPLRPAPRRARRAEAASRALSGAVGLTVRPESCQAPRYLLCSARRAQRCSGARHSRPWGGARTLGPTCHTLPPWPAGPRGEFASTEGASVDVSYAQG